MSVLYQADAARGKAWSALFAQQAPDIAFHVWPAPCDLNAVETLIAWEPKPELLARLPNLKLLYSVGAGIDHLDLAALPRAVQVLRMIEPGIIHGVVEYVCMAVLTAHRNLLDYREQQALQLWRTIDLVPACSRRVGVMGLGVLGQAVLTALGSFGFARYGWSRSARQLPAVTTYAGPDQLQAFLAQCDVLICLLPLTGDTRGILDQHTLAALPRGAVLINAGRGGHLVEPALLAALDSQQLSRAFIDVCETEPPPADHPYWRHPRIVLTPHIAGMTMPETAVPVVIENLRRHRRGEALRGLIDRTTGY
jgi:glyoxylate/hydroxypyruvate reductase A